MTIRDRLNRIRNRLGIMKQTDEKEFISKCDYFELPGSNRIIVHGIDSRTEMVFRHFVHVDCPFKIGEGLDGELDFESNKKGPEAAEVYATNAKKVGEGIHAHLKVDSVYIE